MNQFYILPEGAHLVIETHVLLLIQCFGVEITIGANYLRLAGTRGFAYMMFINEYALN